VYNVDLIDIREEWDAIVANVKSMSKKNGNSTEIGVFGDQSIVTIAIENEFGDPPRPSRKWRIPERSFLRHIFDRDKEKIAFTMQNMASDILIGKEKMEVALGKLGSSFEKKVKKFIISGYYKATRPNHPITVRIKGHAQPLIQIGKLYSVITHKITGKSVKIK